MANQFVGYYRVSTDRQGRSALGLEAQRESVTQLTRSLSGELISEFTEVESGRKRDRPQLLAAIRECRKRNATFLLQLRDSGVGFTAADMPHADRFTVGILALVAERERDLISARTREALAAAKRRGTILGCPTPKRASALGVAAVRAKVEAFDANLIPVVRRMQSTGVTTLRGIAGALNARGLKTRRGGEWSPEGVRVLLRRAR